MAEATDSETKDSEVLGSPPQTINITEMSDPPPLTRIRSGAARPIDPYIMEIGTSSTAAPLPSSASQMIATCAPHMTDQYSVDIHPEMNIPNQTCAAQYSIVEVPESAQQTTNITERSDRPIMSGAALIMGRRIGAAPRRIGAAPRMSGASQTIRTHARQTTAQDSDFPFAISIDVSEIGSMVSSESAQQTIDTSTPQMSASRLEVTKDIEELIQDCGYGRLSQHRCIYRVPSKLRELKKNAYTPKVVSIGPFHCRNEGLQDMQRHKHIFFKRFMERTESSCCKLVEFVQKLEPRVRASYSETLNLTEKELVKLTLMDAVFIIELFSMSMDELRKDAKLSQPWLADSILLDLLLLENQLPFFVIQKLFNEALPHDRHGILELTHAYFRYHNRRELESHCIDGINHFTDLLRLFYCGKKTPERKPNPNHSSDLLRWFCLKRKTSERKPNSEAEREEVPEDGSHILLYNANALQEVGVKLKDCTSGCLLDVEFSGNILKIPHIVVDDNTELLFRNMIALEQCHYPGNADITDYALLLDWLINTEKDVDLLVHQKIVTTYLGDTKNVATLFNGLSVNCQSSLFGDLQKIE